jgi:hypothetical protein
MDAQTLGTVEARPIKIGQSTEAVENYGSSELREGHEIITKFKNDNWST